MQDPPVVGVVHGPSYLGDQAGRLAGRERAVGQALGEVPPFDVLHYDVRQPGLVADVVHRDDVRVLELGDRFGFRQESPAVGLGR
jgi:hypothetical protein